MRPMEIPTTRDATGAMLHAIPVPPAALPRVPPEALLAAWRRASRAAELHRWGPVRHLAFAGAAGALSLTDQDACCWAESVDAAEGLETLPGMALCLRLLALVELLGRARWAAGMFDIGPLGIELHPSLLAAAARQPLGADARFDAEGFRRLLSRSLPAGESRCAAPL